MALSISPVISSSGSISAHISFKSLHSAEESSCFISGKLCAVAATESKSLADAVP